MDWLTKLEAIFNGFSPEEMEKKKEIEKFKSILLGDEDEEVNEEKDKEEVDENRDH